MRINRKPYLVTGVAALVLSAPLPGSAQTIIMDETPEREDSEWVSIVQTPRVEVFVDRSRMSRRPEVRDILGILSRQPAPMNSYQMWVKYEYADAKRIKGATERHKPVKRVIQQTILNCAAERIANLDAEEAISMISGRPPSRVESTVQAWFVDSLGAITVATDSNDDALWNARESLYSAEWRQHSGGNVPFDRASTEACRVATEAFGK